MFRRSYHSVIIAGILILMAAGFVRVATAKSESSDSLRAFYDALALKQYVRADTFLTDESTKMAISGYFTRYLPDSLKAKYSTVDAILAFIKSTNPFLNSFIKTEVPKMRTLKRGLEVPSMLSSSPPTQYNLGTLAGLDVTNIAQGLSLFMIERAKDELNVAFFGRLKDFFKNHPEIAILFPKTSAILPQLLDYRYTQMLPVLRSAFFDDLRTCPEHFDDVLALPKYLELTKKFPELRLFAQTFKLADEFQNGRLYPSEMISKFSQLEVWTDANSTVAIQNAGDALALANIFSQSLLDTGAAGGWIRFSKLDSLLIRDSVSFRLYAGLLYQNINSKNIKFIHVNGAKNDTTKFCTVMSKYKDDLFEFQRVVELLIQTSDEFTTVYKEVKAKKDAGTSISNEDYCRYVRSGIDLVEQYLNVTGKFYSDPDYANCLLITRNGLNSFEYASQGNYSGAILAGSCALSEAITMIEERHIKSCPLKHSVNTLAKVASGIAEYGVFMASVVEAKTPEDVKNAIDAAALPVGSSAIKKNSWFNICIQGYLGAYFGIQQWSYNNTTAWSDPYGVIAPIGISISPPGFGKVGVLSVFGSLFDLGAIVDYDLKTEISPIDSSITIKKDYKIELGDLFSPGVYLVYGFPFNMPLSVGAGVQYGPGLGTITSGGGTVINNPKVRYNAFLAVDIPFFNIVNCPHYWKKP